ncbi:MAG: hypothetical protein CMJ77_16795 [Planctomycetaceae bacterium]|nr:hypothetical protein [Planctomycetaceae bacterium]
MPSYVPFLIAGYVGWMASATLADEIDAGNLTYDQHVKTTLSAYCMDCHGADEPEAALNLARFDIDSVDVSEATDVWARVLEMVESGEMPPEQEAQPTAEEKKQLVTWLESALESVDCRKISQPGRVTIRKLNRAEYNNTIRDLVGIDFRPAEDFPADNVGNGFDNIAQVLSLPPLLMEKYLEAAEVVVNQAFDDEQVRAQIIFATPGENESHQDVARQVICQFAERAFRRPVDDAEIERLTTLYQLGRDNELDYVDSLRLPLQAILASPQFLYRIEFDLEPDADDQTRPLNDYELATRLSYFLWSSMPDAELIELAAEDRLDDPEVLDKQVRRMLQDEKSQALVDNFAGQWLELRNLSKAAPDPVKFPKFDEELRTAMRRETDHFFAALIRQDRSVLDLIDADYTFVNERLANHYGMDGVDGDEFREVKITDNRRGGVLTHASILTLTSNPTRTSPVKRGKWILENILGTPPPPPPPGVEELMEEEETELLGTLRERMEQHREDPSCAVCHRKMDVLGFGFENFDGIGSWRDRDGRFEIDPSGKLPGDRVFRSPAELRVLLKDVQRDQFVRCIAEKMLTYAVGRGLESYDRCAVDEIVKAMESNEYRFSALVMAVVNSEPFRLRGFRGEVK